MESLTTQIILDTMMFIVLETVYAQQFSFYVFVDLYIIILSMFLINASFQKGLILVIM